MIEWVARGGQSAVINKAIFRLISAIAVLALRTLKLDPAPDWVEFIFLGINFLPKFCRARTFLFNSNKWFVYMEARRCHLTARRSHIRSLSVWSLQVISVSVWIFLQVPCLPPTVQHISKLCIVVCWWMFDCKAAAGEAVMITYIVSDLTCLQTFVFGMFVFYQNIKNSNAVI